MFDARTLKLLATLKGHTGEVSSVAFSPDRDGGRLVTGSEDRTVRLWDLRTGTALIELKGHTGMVTTASFTPDGTRIVCAGYGERGKPGEVFVCYARPAPLKLHGHTDMVASVVFSPDSSRVATASPDGMVKLWDTRTGALLHNVGGIRSRVPHSAAFSPDGTRLVTARDQGDATVWDVQTGTAVFDLKGRPGLDVYRVAFSPDGTRIVNRNSGGDKALVWDARSGTEVLNEPIPVTHEPGLFSPDGRLFARMVENSVELVALKPDPEELEYRLLHTRPNPWRYREAYLAARAAKDDFAAAFYLNLVPPADRQAVLAQADAVADAALSKLGEEYMVARRWDDAVPLLIEVLNVNRAKLGPEDPATIQSVDNLGRAYYQTGQFAKAIPLLEDVWKTRRAKEGQASQQTRYVMQLLIESYRLTGEHAKIVNVLAEQLPADRKSMLADSPELAEVLAQLGGAYLALKRWAEAAPLLRECVTIREKSRPDDWNTSDAQSMLGGAILGQRKYADAEPLLLKGYEGMKAREKSIPPQANTRIPESLDRLIELYTSTGKPEETRRWRAERAKYPFVAPPPREKK
ncbi:MAG: tetratricopeptide repeat protein [Gemmataceae bacterium]